MRVAFITVGDTKRRTGGYLYHAEVFARLREKGVEVEEVVPCGAAPEEQERTVDLLGELMQPSDFDLIVVDALARIVCAPHLERWRERRPVVAMVHELPSVADPGNAERESVFEEPLLRSDLLICVSEHGRSILQKRGVPASRIRVVSPGFDRLSRPGAGPSVRDGGPLRTLCVAQWIPRKGILDLIRAWTAHKRLGSALILIGETTADPAYTSSVHEAIAAAPGSSIIVRGCVDDTALARAYAGADLFVLPSRYEGYGMVFAEALACGLPIVACDVGPVPELVGEEAALLVPPGDDAALSEALDRLLSAPPLRAQMAEAARKRAGSLPNWDDTAEGFFGVLHEAVGGAGRPGT